MKLSQFSIRIVFLFITILPISCAISQIDPSAKISDSKTSIIGFNHIGISVQNLDEMLEFYTSSTGFEVVKREKVSNSKNADKLLGKDGISYETATLKGPNMLLELTQYTNQKQVKSKKMPPQGPGMTHTCFQSPKWYSGYDKFKNNGADVLSRGNSPVDLGGYGVTYAYVYDPDGNMIELEQLAQNRIIVDSTWIESNQMWMTQVALMSPDLKRIANFYQMVLGIPPNRESKVTNHPRLDDIIDYDSTSILMTWFKMDGIGKMLELMQYIRPETPQLQGVKHPTDLGYSFSLEVTDIHQEYDRLSKNGVEFLSEPLILGEFWIAYANDIDGNVFSLRQAISSQSTYSVLNMKVDFTD